MENVVSIIKSRENELEFDISIQGVEDEGTQVRFVIDASPAALVFACTHKDGDKWVVTVPPMPQIEAISYDFHIEIVVGGYFFTPFKGTINVTNEPEVKSSGVGAPVTAPVVNATIKVNGEESEEKEMKAEKPTKAEKKEVKVVVDAEESEEEEKPKKTKKDAKPIPDDYKELADQLIKNHKDKKVKETAQGKKVKAVLKDLEKKKKEEPKEETKDEKPKDEPKEEKPTPKKKKTATKKKPAKKKEKVEESAPIIPRGSTLSSVIDDFKKPEVVEVDAQAKKVQDILKTLH